MDADIQAVAERWTPETEELAAGAIQRGPGDHEWVECLTEARGVLAALAEAGLLLPPGGVVREVGGIQLLSGLIVSMGWSSEPPTHRRRVVSWAGEGPNDNWPRYLGPWIEVAPDPCGNCGRPIHLGAKGWTHGAKDDDWQGRRRPGAVTGAVPEVPHVA